VLASQASFALSLLLRGIKLTPGTITFEASSVLFAEAQ